ncbi:MAG: DUF1566 domain-containing protein [Desulfobacterales bacterium]|nr:DUF1566 domain-containing protein [Desulfobacterales bacterium]
MKLVLTEPTNATLDTSEVLLTILNDDASQISISVDNVDEGDSGTTEALATVMLSKQSNKEVTVKLNSEDVTATAPSDYTAISNKEITFTAGETSQEVSISIHGDTTVESDEQLKLVLTDPTNATLYTSEVLLTILEDEPLLNDTGIDWGGDDTSGNNATCASDISGPQDCHQGRDADPATNDDGDGHAGFSFTKVSSVGVELPLEATAWNCIKDNVTGLMWENKTTDDGLHDKNDRYNWYNTDSTTNGGADGHADGYICDGYDIGNTETYCNTQAYVARVNLAGWCGYNDWRLPNREELRSIVDYSIPSPGPTIDTEFFPNTVNSYFWSASPYASVSSAAWVVGFYYGYDGYYSRDSDRYVRLVRGGQ